MRVLIKGGVWKNTEDEILKAAVMKYGKNQWARVASLLARKSAKQCKARWYEWLDPSIKKTEWSREEEEKLLHLAKLMPSQWRTIAPIVGRTAAQCMEHYEKLLDAAQSKDSENADDPRRLRPGEIDPNPENKPARPDPIDMDEDEKEMLSEARARLANTKGKKAKRKAREKQLQEAKRLASLQKRRELKAAGINPDLARDVGTSLRSKKRKAIIDYVKEIPFEKRAPVGFYDVSSEKSTFGSALDPKATALYLDKLEGERRDVEEKKERRLDARRQKKLLSSALPQQIAAINSANDPSAMIKRKALELPAPMVSNDELSQLAKQGAEDIAHAQMLALEHAQSTQSLMTSYEMTPQQHTMTPHRPVASTSRDALMQEAANQAAMASVQTPLLGGENIELQAGTGYGGITPRSELIKATPASTLRTPQSSLRTPMRDQLGINAEPLVGLDVSRKAEKARQRTLAEQLQSGFATLPSAEYGYDIAIPEKLEESTQDEHFQEDASQREARQAAQLVLESEKAVNRRSSAFQRKLPAPLHVDGSILRNIDGPAADELRALLTYDIADAKKKSTKKGSGAKKSMLTEIPDKDMHYARSLVALEAKLHPKQDSLSISEWWKLQDSFQWDPQQQSVVEWNTLSHEDQVKLLTSDFKRLQEHEAKLLKKASKLEQKVGILHGGYEQKCSALGAAMQTTQSSWLQSERDGRCFENLQTLESAALPLRLVKVAREVDALQLKEVELQKKFAALIEEKDALVSV
ncbi:cell division cycle 5-related protein [Thraustotheca clavata]|uniref:Cell division cycle 5-related protein n=1 Tax=Thraustotheca clavata TaxID=74557 RepID=A0A1V9ZXD8_9STRA|nr:cell division cycle 5-related protein [Thraustotheca clavata]